ncbi:xylulokinase [Leadbettera azotonutricia]|uniref:Xylulose kinase n=1 Tax=Leadbettera azotonutricia (strain ATCC BAA-888 / DSM 13862 / ZAS-9) TaxID=545695 RepID=F5Y8N6_LEAAZ|nr:xylulokinase [Leadbettera azotonutricia]AEF80306.1 xylulokinase [Leadbettera azotonutricia ZAS-9]
MKTVCGIDLGTQSCKIIIYDYEKKTIVDSASAAVDMIAENDGTREQKAEWYEEALKSCFGKLDNAAKKTIAAVGVSGHQHSLVPLDAKGKALYNVKLWCDTSTQAECEELTKAAGGEAKLIKTAGLPMRPGYTAPKVQWLKNHKPKAFAKLKHILLSHDYINFLLTGTYTAEFGDASGSALFDVSKRQWSKKVSGYIDPSVFAALPPLVEAGELAGTVSAAAAALYGIPEGAIVSAGGGDNMMSAIGTGTVSDGFLTMSLGTSGTLFGFSKTPVIDPSGDLAAFCSSSGGWLPLLCTMNCTVASEEFRALFGLDVKAFDAEAAKSPIGADGVAVLPFFNGERTPNLPHGRASINGITASNFKRENLARAALESAIFGMRIGLEGFKKLGFKAKEIRLTGGGSKSPLWQSIAANVMNLPVRVPKGAEAAALGGAIQGLWALERQKTPKLAIDAITEAHVAMEGGATVKPDAKAVKAYNEAYGVYSRYLGALSPLYK